MSSADELFHNGQIRPMRLPPLVGGEAPREELEVGAGDERGGRLRCRRRSAHERMYAARRAEVEEMRRRTFLPYQQGLLFGCLGLTSRLSSAAAGKSRS
uniref:Uncharacterized protein n=1 Tax=Oryza barthii TaxID=65489 RepID=A0A0D3HVL8_9ORYZ